MLPASRQLSKSCAFCSYRADDEALFADHMFRVHRWGTAPAGPPSDERLRADAVPASEAVTYCYGCASPNPARGARFCVQCGNRLELAPSGLRIGQVYALNHVEVLLQSGLVDGDTAARLSSHYRAALGVSSAPPIAVPRAAPEAQVTRPPVRSVSPPEPTVPAGPGLFSPERAPSLLLYVGAFLIVVAALIFVSVSGQQISGEVKLSLLILGTFGFIGVGLFCHRYPRVVEAGTTFMFIGALLVPLDFVAYHVLLSGQALSASMVWTLGSLAAAGLYAALAATDFGRAYASLFLLAAVSAVAGLESILSIDDSWFFLPIALVPILITLAGVVVADIHVQRIAAPLTRPGSLLASITLALSAAVVPIFESVGPQDRRVTLVTFVVASLYYGLRARNGGRLDRWRAVLGPVAVAIAIVYLLHGATQTYGFAFALVAIAYATAAEAMRVGLGVPVPAWLRDACERVAVGAAAAAILPIQAYWRTPFVGATVDLMLAAAMAVVCVRRAAAWNPVVRALLVTSAVLLHLGVALYLVGVGLVHGGSPPYRFVGREIALAFAPLSALLALAAWLARARLPQLRRDLALIALGSAVATLLYAYDEPVLATILGSLAGGAAVAAARATGVPRILWLGAGALAYAALNADRWLSPPHEVRPIALSLVALAVFVPAALPRWRSLRYAATARDIGLASAVLAMVVGLISLATPLRPAADPVWLATIPALLVFGVIGLTDGILRRQEEEILVSSGFFLAATLMLIARTQPAQLELYTVPVGVYLTVVAWALAHWHMALRPSLEAPVRIVAAIAFVAPTYVLSWFDRDATRGIIVLIEAALILIAAAWLDDRELGWTGVGVMGGMLVRGIGGPLVFESATAAFGALAIGLTLAARRSERWRSRIVAIHEPTEVVASLLIVAPPLARAMARGPDALDQGASALAISVVLVALALWSARRAILAVGIGAAAAVGLLALPDSDRAEPYVASAGIALLALALAAARLSPRSFPAAYLRTLEVTAAALLLSGAAERTFSQGGDAATRLALEAIALCAVGIYFARPDVTYVGVAGSALVAWWVLGDTRARELHGSLVGAVLVLVSLYAARLRTGVLDPRAHVAMEAGGAFLFIGPTLIAGWSEPFFPRTPMVFFEIFLVLGAGMLLHRRWLVAGALAALGLESIRALIDVINRLPNYLLFASSGALLLGIGFVLLLKREAWREWSQRVTLWWSRV